MLGSIYIQLLLIAFIVVFVVDLSGFTQSWQGTVRKLSKGKVHIGKPFDCSLCMVFWVCVVFSFLENQLNVIVFAYICALAFFADVIGGIFTIVKSSVNLIMDKIFKL